MHVIRRAQKTIPDSHVHVLGLRPKMTPPPNPLSWSSTLIKRVSNCLESKQLSACTVLMPNNAIFDELQGEMVCARSCTDHLFRAQIQPKPSPKHFLLQSCNFCILQCVNCKFGINCWFCLNTPPQPTWGHNMHFYDQTPRPPPLIKSPNKGANRLGLS